MANKASLQALRNAAMCGHPEALGLYKLYINKQIKLSKISKQINLDRLYHHQLNKKS